MIVVLMGVSGSGKTTIGILLAESAQATFADADDYHSQEHKKKMAGGHPLNDQDRQPWLETLNQLLQRWQREGKSGVLACSALKTVYRQTLAAGMPRGAVLFTLLDGSQELIAERLARRDHEYMNSNLLASQLETLERPTNGEAYRVVNDRPPELVVAEILEYIRSVNKNVQSESS